MISVRPNFFKIEFSALVASRNVTYLALRGPPSTRLPLFRVEDMTAAAMTSSFVVSGSNVSQTAAPLASVTSYRERVTRFYQQYAPEKLVQVDAALFAYRGRETELMEALVAKYGAEPFAPGVTSAAVLPVDVGAYRERLIKIYLEYDPSAVIQVDGALVAFRGREDEMIAAAVAKYGPEPDWDSRVKRLERYYSYYCPAKVPFVKDILFAYAGEHSALLSALRDKYGPVDPTDVAEKIRHQQVTHAMNRGAGGAAAAAANVAPVTSDDVTRFRLRDYFSRYAPEKLFVVDDIIAAYSGRHVELFERLEMRYGPEVAVDVHEITGAAKKMAVTERHVDAAAVGSAAPLSSEAALAATERSIFSDEESIKKRVTAFYEFYDPGRVDDVAELLRRVDVATEGAALFGMLERKYGPEAAVLAAQREKTLAEDVEQRKAARRQQLAARRVADGLTGTFAVAPAVVEIPPVAPKEEATGAATAARKPTTWATFTRSRTGPARLQGNDTGDAVELALDGSGLAPLSFNDTAREGVVVLPGASLKWENAAPLDEDAVSLVDPEDDNDLLDDQGDFFAVGATAQSGWFKAGGSDDASPRGPKGDVLVLPGPGTGDGIYQRRISSAAPGSPHHLDGGMGSLTGGRCYNYTGHLYCLGVKVNPYASRELGRHFATVVTMVSAYMASTALDHVDSLEDIQWPKAAASEDLRAFAYVKSVAQVTADEDRDRASLVEQCACELKQELLRGIDERRSITALETLVLTEFDTEPLVRHLIEDDEDLRRCALVDVFSRESVTRQWLRRPELVEAAWQGFATGIAAAFASPKRRPELFNTNKRPGMYHYQRVVVARSTAAGPPRRRSPSARNGAKKISSLAALFDSDLEDNSGSDSASASTSPSADESTRFRSTLARGNRAEPNDSAALGSATRRRPQGKGASSAAAFRHCVNVASRLAPYVPSHGPPAAATAAQPPTRSARRPAALPPTVAAPFTLSTNGRKSNAATTIHANAGAAAVVGKSQNLGGRRSLPSGAHDDICASPLQSGSAQRTLSQLRELARHYHPQQGH